MKKYLLHPGYVFSSREGNKHYINSRELQRLYKLKSFEFEVCLACKQRRPLNCPIPNSLGLIDLRPRSDGNYNLFINEV